jgi:ferredoxin/flavodoxin---NADP+ reductase
MSKILKKEQLSEAVWRFRLEAPLIAKKRKAGQFIILRVNEEGERIPLTIANGNADEGWIEIIFQVVGYGTTKLAQINEGDNLQDLVGPLGHPTHVENFGKVLCIGGGVGIAPLYPIVCALKAAGNDVTTIIGSRTKDLLILEEEMKAQSNQLFVATDDGSCGHHGFVSDVFNDLITKGEKFDFAIVIGPPIMMKVTTKLTVAAGIKTEASLNPIMIDGTGMCGGCRVSVFGETKFACVDGPEFDAAGIDWDLLIERLGSYRPFEEKEMHKCKLETKN